MNYTVALAVAWQKQQSNAYDEEKNPEVSNHLFVLNFGFVMKYS